MLRTSCLKGCCCGLSFWRGAGEGGGGAYYGNEFCSLKVVPGFDNKIK